MEARANDLFLVTVNTPWSVYEDIIEAKSLQRAAVTGAARRFGSVVDPSKWSRRGGPPVNAHRTLTLQSSRPSINVTAEALTY